MQQSVGDELGFKPLAQLGRICLALLERGTAERDGLVEQSDQPERASAAQCDRPALGGRRRGGGRLVQ